jgi:glycosyltransferase involved in cell wall biosynthesis
MRVGQNPNRDKGAECYMPIILSVVTHLPNQLAYHAKRFDVIKRCLTSMRQNAEQDATIIVWDNGSCGELRNWLQDVYKPDMLMLSTNIGKTAARTSILRMCPPDSIIGYADDDIYFYPGWLQPQLDLLKGFPHVAAVSGYPVRTAFRWGTMNTIAWAGVNGKLEIGRFIPKEYEDDFCRSIGRDIPFHMVYTKDDRDYRVTYQGKTAYCTAHHCQFIGYQETLVQAAKYDGEAMGDEKPLDVALDNLGLRLCTTNRLTRHMGNIMEENYA